MSIHKPAGATASKMSRTGCRSEHHEKMVGWRRFSISAIAETDLPSVLLFTRPSIIACKEKKSDYYVRYIQCYQKKVPPDDSY